MIKFCREVMNLRIMLKFMNTENIIGICVIVIALLSQKFAKNTEIVKELAFANEKI